MDWMNRISIKSRMVLTFAFMLLFFIIFAVFSIVEMNKLGKLTSDLYDHPLKVSNAALSAEANILRMHRSMKDVSISRTDLESQTAIQAVALAEKDVYEQLDIVKGRILGKEGKALVQETIAMFSGWKPIRKEVQELVLKGDRQAAGSITRGKGADYVARLNRKMMELSSYAENKADGFMKNARKVQQRILRNTIIAIAMVGLLSLFITYWIAQGILSSVSDLKETMSEITKTGALVKSDLSGNNEIAEMAQHFNSLVDRLQGQSWFRDGQNALNYELSGDITYEGLVTKATNFISRYVDACAGALYVYDEKRSLCELKASYALVEGKHFSSEFGIGEGIVGQVAIEQKPVLISGITREDALGKTGTVSEPPRSIYALPLLYEGRLYGVFEVALFEEIAPLKIELLQMGAKIISTSLYVATQKEQVKRLLELTQKNNEELQAQTEELQQQSEELQQTSEELQEQNAELEVQKEQVEAANRLKSEFLSNMSHELRTPLNSVMALSRVLIRQAKDKLSEEELNYLKVIARNGKSLLELINDILDLAKIEVGKMDVSLKLFSLGSAVETIMERLEPVAKEKGIKMQLKTPDDLPQIESDEVRVHQILQNLISNAVKFTTEGSVTVSAINDTENINIKIADTGIGIADKDLPHIFEEFRQVDGSSARAYEGTGLGLTIAYKAARMLEGELKVESVLGEGSIFTLTLPIKPQEIISWSEPGATMAPVETAQARKAVLVVDDDPDVAAMIADYLIREGYYALTATSGAQALELAAKHRPFAITLDIIMPDMDGWEVLQRLKETPGTKDIPVIIISVADDREIGFALGAIGYITKPVNKDMLLAEIKKFGGSASHTVLIVDDNALESKEMAQIIEQEGMRAVVADSGIKCMQMIGESIPDVLVLDLIMPDMDGFEVLERLRSDPATRSLPVVVVTAKELTDQDREKLTGNVSSMLAKSDTTSSALLEKIKKILGDIDKYPRPEDPKTAKQILLVEDNEAAMIQVRSILEREGYGVDVARGGQEALEYLGKTIPDGIILDLMMPDVDGFEVLENIRSHGATAKVPVLILTAKDLTPEDLKKIRGNNIQQLIQKGDVARENLLFKVKSMLGEKMPTAVEIRDPQTISFQAEQAKTRQPEPAKARKIGEAPTILVIEDNPDNMISIKAVLHNKYTMLEATDGEEGLNMALTERPDLILLDMSLPKMDGFTVVGKIKEEEKTRHITTIALTARAMKGDREMILEAGCDDYISKPIEPEEILKKIEGWVRKLS